MENLDLLHLPVRTKSGQPLGVITDTKINPDTQSVISYCVKSHRLLPAMVARELIIHRSQVIAFDQNGMVVDDAVLRQTAQGTAPQPAA